jgi:hypothetical protein
MKKILSLAIAIMILSGLAQAASLKLVKPNGGEKWAPGSNQQVLWTSDGVTAKVKLILYRNGSKLGRIVSGLNAGAGSYGWTAGNHEGGIAPAGDGYTIRVQTLDDAVKDESDASFSIAEAGTSSGGSTQVVTRQSDREVHLAKPELSLPNYQQAAVAKILRIDRIEPAVLLNTFGSSASVIGQGFSATQPARTYLVAETVAYSRQFKLNVSAWSDGRIDFSRNQLMSPDDYLVFVGYEQPRIYDPISNKLPLRIEASEYSYINSIQPGSIITGEAQHEIEIGGFGFAKPHDSRGATVWFNGIPRPISVVSWSDTLIRGHFSTLLIPPATRCEIVVHHIKDGVTHYSNREIFYVNPR